MPHNISAKRINLIVIMILGFFPLIGMGIDLITPSLPAISHHLAVSNTISKNLITIYLLGYALGNFVIGFLSDAWGRRSLIIIGFLVFVAASLLPAVFPYISILLFARLLQGAAIASFAVLSRAIFSDILEPERLTRIAALISIMWGIGPIIGPIIGGYLQYYFNWQACFYFFAVFGFLGFLVMFFYVPETHFNRQPFQLSQIKNNFVIIVTHRIFIGSVILMGLSYSLLIVFNTLGPFLIQIEFGRSPVYFGHLALSMGVAFLAGSIICRQLIEKYQPENILLLSLIIFLFTAILGIIAAYINNKNIWVVIVPSLFMFFGCGILYPTSMGKSLSLFRHLAGSSSAVMILINILITSLTAFVMSFIHADNAMPIAAIYFGLLLLSGLSYWHFVYKKI